MGTPYYSLLIGTADEEQNKSKKNVARRCDRGGVGVLRGNRCTAYREGAHVFAHSRKDGKEGVVYLVINNSLTEATTVELPKSAERYTLAGEGGNVRAAVMTLNGKPLILGAGNSLPELTPAAQEAGTVTLAPATCTFFVL